MSGRCETCDQLVHHAARYGVTSALRAKRSAHAEQILTMCMQQILDTPNPYRNPDGVNDHDAIVALIAEDALSAVQLIHAGKPHL